jgi:hypothetical protein
MILSNATSYVRLIIPVPVLFVQAALSLWRMPVPATTDSNAVSTCIASHNTHDANLLLVFICCPIISGIPLCDLPTMATSVVLPSTSALSSARRCREEAARLLYLAAPQRRRVRASSRCRVVAAVGPEVADAASVAVEAIAPTMMTVKFFASGGVSACASHSVGVPLDVVKTRVQVVPPRYHLLIYLSFPQCNVFK